MDSANAVPARVDRYAAALLEIARAEGEDAGLTDEIYAAARALSGNSKLTDVLADPRIPHDRKRGIIDDLIGRRASQVTVAAVHFVVAAGEANHLGDIAERLAELAAEAEGEVVAEIRTPMELDPIQIERLTAALQSATGRRVQVKIVIDPTVMGGLVAKVGDTVLDGSVQNRFTELREQWG
jgi:F-type H+-transporting ATPase subunit delta